jgi:Sulfatase
MELRLDETTESHVKPSFVAPATRLALLLCALQVILFELLRLLLYVRNRDLSSGADVRTIASAFLFGLRFDLSTAAYVTLPLLMAAKLVSLRWGVLGERRAYAIGACIIGVMFMVLGLAELEFYHEFSCRYNRIAVNYFSQPGRVCTMIWGGFPVLRYSLLAAAMSLGFGFGIVRLVRCNLPDGLRAGSYRFSHLAQLFIVTTMLVLAARGGWQRKPLQWGDAVHSKSIFANQLAQNGIWTLTRDLVGGTGHNGAADQLDANLPDAEARARAQNLLLLPHEDLTQQVDRYPLLRQSRLAARSMSLNQTTQQPPNVVLIMLESFSARFVGAVGADADHTPEYNRLAKQGILFDRCFSNGTRTHQAHFTIMASFPNLPSTEWLMQDNLGNQPFDSLPGAMRRHGYQTMYMHNGHLDWDNVEGFFKIQGIDRFIGRDDFDRKKNFIGTWGVLDNVLFERANRVFAETTGPFFATIMTATNHVPFECPRPYPIVEVTDAGSQNARLNGVRFSDWALGQFFEMARHEAYFANTLFVIVGDHGVNTPPVLTELNLLHHHVPLLFYAPALLGSEPRRIHTVASHVDIAPTILGLLGETEPHQFWGRDLFALGERDEGFAWMKTTAEPSLGMVRGDRLLVKTPDGTKLYQYDLGFPPQAKEIDSPDPGATHGMLRDLQAYAQTALDVLRARNAAPLEHGIPATRSSSLVDTTARGQGGTARQEERR